MRNHRTDTACLGTSIKIGVLFCTLLFGVSSCNERNSTAPSDEIKPKPAEITSSTPNNVEEQITQPKAEATQVGKRIERQNKEGQITPYGGTRVLFYNVRNYLDMDRRIGGKYLKDQSKPKTEIAALVEVIKSANPDILGLCEIGGDKELNELQAMLKDVGIDLPHRELVKGWDRSRRLALLSKFPITERLSQTDLEYPISGSRLNVSRGILDVIVDVNGEPLELLAAHLKSKREIKKYDQAEMRRNEAKILRKRMDEILKKNPDAKFAVMGDFNDTSKAPAIEVLRGRYNTPLFCDSLDLKATDGTYWTQFWSWQHVYSRFDYFFVSPGLDLQVDHEQSRIIDHPKWAEASDHRAILMILK